MRTRTEVATWFDLHPTATIRRASGLELCAGESADQRIILWLSLVDLRLDQLCNDRAALEWDWRQGYEDGWSPRTAAFAAWAKRLRMVRMRSSVVPSHAFA